MDRRRFLETLALSGACLSTSGLELFGVEIRSSETTGEIARNVTRRDAYRFTQAQTQFLSGSGDVAFLGGSITEMEGYRPKVCAYLEKKYPKTDFHFVAAGVASTCSDYGAFRVESDVLSRCKKGAPDLFFVEFAVNDDQDGRFSLEHSIRGMEGIVRRILKANPKAGIVMIFFANEHLLSEYAAGRVATSIQAHRAVAERYGVATIDVAHELQQRIAEGTLSWQEYGGVHPADRGNQMTADMISTLLDSVWSKPATCTLCTMIKEDAPLDAHSYTNATWLDWERDGFGDFELVVPEWNKIRGGFRATFAGWEFLCGSGAGSEFTYGFTGNATGLFVLAGPDACLFERQIDDGEWVQMNAYHDYSEGLHYPRMLVIADGLEEGPHRARVRIVSGGRGESLRIGRIGVNRAEEKA